MILIGQVYGRVICNRTYVAKDINFGVGARAAMLQGVSEVAEAVKVTMGPKVMDTNIKSSFILLLHINGIIKNIRHDNGASLLAKTSNSGFVNDEFLSTTCISLIFILGCQVLRLKYVLN